MSLIRFYVYAALDVAARRVTGLLQDSVPKQCEFSKVEESPTRRAVRGSTPYVLLYVNDKPVCPIHNLEMPEFLRASATAKGDLIDVTRFQLLRAPMLNTENLPVITQRRIKSARRALDNLIP